MPEENEGIQKEQTLSKQCNASAGDAAKPRRIELFTKVAFWSAVLGWGCCFLVALVDMRWETENIAIMGIMAINLVALLSGVVGLLRIKLRKNEFTGTSRVPTGLLLSLLFWIIIAPAVINARQGAEIVRLLYNVKQLGQVISAYYSEHNFNYPPAEKWCDILVEYDPNVKEFLKPERHIWKKDTRQCVYALNPDCKPNSPADTVLLFETKGGWNQYGGPELMGFDNHSIKGAAALLKCGYTIFVKPDKIGEWKWKPDEPNSIQTEKAK
jgi:hypothetical protein